MVSRWYGGIHLGRAIFLCVFHGQKAAKSAVAWLRIALKVDNALVVIM